MFKFFTEIFNSSRTKFRMPDTWIWVDVIDINECVITDRRYGIGKRDDDKKDIPCICHLLGEFEDKFILMYEGHGGLTGWGTQAPDGIVFMLPKEQVLSWEDEIREQDTQREKLRNALKSIFKR